MPHIHTEPGQHDASVTAFIVRLDLDEPRLLLMPHKKLASLLPPGGHVELDETPWGALAHELKEETGYTFDDLDVVQPKTRLKNLSQITLHPQPILSNSHYIPHEHYHTDLDYLFIANGDPKTKPHEGEVQELRWVTQSEVNALRDDEIMSNIREISDYVFSVLLTADDHERISASLYSTSKIQHDNTKLR